ncbi:MAG: hypothetical protein GY711_08525 [bacterium]|nr:hypothetical protein [bacterium]
MPAILEVWDSVVGLSETNPATTINAPGADVRFSNVQEAFHGAPQRSAADPSRVRDRTLPRFKSEKKRRPCAVSPFKERKQ